MKIPIIFVAGLAVILGGCENPWMKSITAPLFKDKPDGTAPGVTMTEEEAKNMADFGVPAIPAAHIHTVSTAAEWAAALAGITGPGSYVINVTENISVTSLPDPTFGTVSDITVSLRGGGSLAYTGLSYANLFIINTGQNLIIRDFTLQGDNDNGWALLAISSGGTATLKAGGKIIDNSATATIASGGVTVSGAFTMEGGEISGNIGGSGGGVYISGSGTFTMSGGEIKDNASPTGQGGGVYVSASATFTKTGGTIYGGSDSPPNTASGGSPGSGHAVYTAAQGGKYRDDTVSDTDNISVSGGICGGTWYPPPV
jgi:hypothetical protein